MMFVLINGFKDYTLMVADMQRPRPILDPIRRCRFIRFDRRLRQAAHWPCRLTHITFLAVVEPEATALADAQEAPRGALLSDAVPGFRSKLCSRPLQACAFLR